MVVQVLLKIIQPYTRVRIPFIAQKLNIPGPDVEQLLVSLILDGRVAGSIDQVWSDEVERRAFKLKQHCESLDSQHFFQVSDF